MIHLHPDFGCSGSNTPFCSLLANTRACDEIFAQANGNVSKCTIIGDLPVIVRTSGGQPVQVTFGAFPTSSSSCYPSHSYGRNKASMLASPTSMPS